jgi:DNA-binding transcriptional ArsR family regulator
MSSSGETEPQIDYEALEAYLKVLGYAGRLRLLSILREPRTLDEIHLAPGRDRGEGTPERSMSRQGVQEHVERLLEAGLLRAGYRRREGRRGAREYVTDPTRLFDVLEELRRACAFNARIALDPLATQRVREDAVPRWPGGPKLVLVHGVEEGRAFPLLPAAPRESGRGWVIGRASGCHVCIPYDPFVSAENAEIVARPDGAFRLVDIRSARNGTSLNWTRLPVGGEIALHDGDVIGVGRSLLVFRRT